MKQRSWNKKGARTCESSIDGTTVLEQKGSSNLQVFHCVGRIEGVKLKNSRYAFFFFVSFLINCFSFSFLFLFYPFLISAIDFSFLLPFMCLYLFSLSLSQFLSLSFFLFLNLYFSIASLFYDLFIFYASST